MDDFTSLIESADLCDPVGITMFVNEDNSFADESEDDNKVLQYEEELEDEYMSDSCDELFDMNDDYEVESDSLDPMDQEADEILAADMDMNDLDGELIDFVDAN